MLTLEAMKREVEYVEFLALGRQIVKVVIY